MHSNSHSATFCEKCCEQIAGSPPEVDMKMALKEGVIQACIWTGKGLFAIVQLIGYAIFFSVAIWFAPISGPLTPKQKREEAERKARAVEEESLRQRRKEELAAERKVRNDDHDSKAAHAADSRERYENDRNSKEIDFTARDNEELMTGKLRKDIDELNQMRKEFLYDNKDDLKKDDNSIDELNDTSKKVRQGIVDPEEARRKQLKIVDDLKKDRTDEINRYREREQVNSQISDIEHKLRSLQRDIDIAERERDYDKASKLYGNESSTIAKLNDLHAKYRSLNRS